MSVIVADTLKARVVGAAVTTEYGLNVGGATTVAGAVVATSFAGDGSGLTGVSGFGTAQASEGILSRVFTTTRQDIVSAGTSVTVDASGGGGGIAFTRLNRIDVGTGATFHIGSGTTMIMNVLNIF